MANRSSIVNVRIKQEGLENFSLVNVQLEPAKTDPTPPPPIHFRCDCQKGFSLNVELEKKICVVNDIPTQTAIAPPDPPTLDPGTIGNAGFAQLGPRCQGPRGPTQPMIYPDPPTLDPSMPELTPQINKKKQPPFMATRSKASAPRLVDENQVSCTICGRYMMNKSLKGHMNIHTREKEFKCPASGCPAVFYSKLTLRNHQLKFHDVQKRNCRFCDAKLECTSADFKTHVREEHPLEAPVRTPLVVVKPGEGFPCQFCPGIVAMETFSFLRQHLIVIHNRPFVCSVCFRAYRDDSTLKHHVEEHHESTSSEEEEEQEETL